MSAIRNDAGRLTHMTLKTVSATDTTITTATTAPGRGLYIELGRWFECHVLREARMPGEPLFWTHAEAEARGRTLRIGPWLIVANGRRGN
jgi:hypothetical protein